MTTTLEELEKRISILEQVVAEIQKAQTFIKEPPDWLVEGRQPTRAEVIVWLKSRGVPIAAPTFEMKARAKHWLDLPEEEKRAHREFMDNLKPDPPLSQIGKTMGSLSMMGKADYRVPPGVLYGGLVYHVPFGDAAAVEKQLDICDKIGVGVAGVVMEPIQGESGAIVPPDDFWPRIREATLKYDTRLLADEVQTGFGRTGRLFGCDHWDVVPDIMTLSKSLSGGYCPIGAILYQRKVYDKVFSSLDRFMVHSTTFGQNDLVAVCGLATLDVIREHRRL